MDVIRIASRRSQLALAQSRLVAEGIAAAHPSLRVDIVPLNTRGDLMPGPLADAGGKGLFTAELEESLRAGRMDIAVHSAKDLPALLPGDLSIIACPPRADARDAVVSRDGASLADLPANPRIGTSSPRRAAQVLATRPDARIVPIRGNVETRLRKVFEDIEAVILAMAGLDRSGLTRSYAAMIRPLDLLAFVPASGQGVLAIEALTERTALRDLTAPLDHAPSHAALLAERSVVRALETDCHSPIGVHVFPQGDRWHGLALVASPVRLTTIVRAQAGPEASAQSAGDALLRQLLDQGARRLLQEV